jgi:hypothetical protein
LFNFIEETNLDLSKRIHEQANYEIINKNERDKLRERIDQYEIENQR